VKGILHSAGCYSLEISANWQLVGTNAGICINFTKCSSVSQQSKSGTKTSFQLILQPVSGRPSFTGIQSISWRGTLLLLKIYSWFDLFPIVYVVNNNKWQWLKSGSVKSVFNDSSKTTKLDNLIGSMCMLRSLCKQNVSF